MGERGRGREGERDRGGRGKLDGEVWRGNRMESTAPGGSDGGCVCWTDVVESEEVKR